MEARHLIRFAQSHEDFRLAELEALARYEGINLNIVEYREESPFCIIAINPNGSHQHKATSTSSTSSIEDNLPKSFITRSILSRSLFELWATGVDYEALHNDIKAYTTHLWPKYRHASFKFSIDAFCGKRSTSKQREIINSFSYLGFKGKIVMKDPESEFVIMEDWDYYPGPAGARSGDGVENNDDHTTIENKRPPPQAPKRVFFGRLIGRSRRDLIDKHDLKKRPYISTTSMDAELALVTANLALAGPGKLFLDPFVGTGGFMVAASELGAMTVGSDIDGRSFKGKGGNGLEKGVGANFRKYNITSLFGDCITSDLTNTPFIASNKQIYNHTRWLDGIISDPPYGVREGLKVLGIRKVLRSTIATTPSNQQESVNTHTESTINNDIKDASIQARYIDGIPAYKLPGYVAPKKPYSFNAMISDILNFAASTLVDKGRLAFWMPSANSPIGADPDTNTNTNTNSNEENLPLPLPLPQHPKLKLIHSCTQPFNKWSRRLLVYERKTDQEISDDNKKREDQPCSSTTTVAVQEPKDAITSPSDTNQGMMTTTTTTTSADDLNPFRKLYFRGFPNLEKDQVDKWIDS